MFLSNGISKSPCCLPHLERCSLFGLLDVQGFIHGLKAVVFSRILGITNKATDRKGS